MLRTTVYLDEEAAVALRHLSRVHNRAQAELIREAINSYIQQLEAKSQRAMPPGVGKYDSGRTDVSVNAEQLLKRRAKLRR